MGEGEGRISVIADLWVALAGPPLVVVPARAGKDRHANERQPCEMPVTGIDPKMSCAVSRARFQRSLRVVFAPWREGPA